MIRPYFLYILILDRALGFSVGLESIILSLLIILHSVIEFNTYDIEQFLWQSYWLSWFDTFFLPSFHQTRIFSHLVRAIVGLKL